MSICSTTVLSFSQSKHLATLSLTTGGAQSGLFQSVALLDASLPTKLCIDDLSMVALCQEEWDSSLVDHPVFRERLEFVDGAVCDVAELVDLLRVAPTTAMRQSLRETIQYRVRNGMALPKDEPYTAALAEWNGVLAIYPHYAAWLNEIDRLTCSKALLCDAMRRAPSVEIRQPLRELFHLRETHALSAPGAIF